MLPHRNPAHLATLWQRMIELDMEAGRRSLLGTGMDPYHVASVPALLAVRRLAPSRLGFLAPLFLVGGEGGTWLWAAILLHQNGERMRPPYRSTVLYAGSDPATYAASLNLPARAGEARGTALPPGMAWMLTPTAVPGSEQLEWEAIPFAQAAPLFTPLVVPPAMPDGIDQLASWSLLLLALALLLAAWFL